MAAVTNPLVLGGQRVIIPPLDLSKLQKALKDLAADEKPVSRIEAMFFIGDGLPQADHQQALETFARKMAEQRMVIAALSNTTRGFQAGKVRARQELDPRLAALIPLSLGLALSVHSLSRELESQKASHAKKDKLYVLSLDNYEKTFGKDSRLRLEGRIMPLIDKTLASYPKDAELQFSTGQALLRKATVGLVDLHLRIYDAYQAAKTADKDAAEGKKKA